MLSISLKTYLLFSITVVLAVTITYYIINYNPLILIPWSTSGLFFILWRIEAEKHKVKKIKKKGIKKLL